MTGKIATGLSFCFAFDQLYVVFSLTDSGADALSEIGSGSLNVTMVVIHVCIDADVDGMVPAGRICFGDTATTFQEFGDGDIRGVHYLPEVRIDDCKI